MCRHGNMVLVQEVALAFVSAGSILFVSLVSVLEIFMSLTMVDFSNFTIELELLDLPAVRDTFTWSRLDRFLVSSF